MLYYEEKEIVALFKQAEDKDEVIRDIAAERNIKKADIFRVLQKYKLIAGPKNITAPKEPTEPKATTPPAPERAAKTVWTPELDQKVERMMKDDMTLVQIADKLNMSVTSLYARRKYLKEKNPTDEVEEPTETKPEPLPEPHELIVLNGNLHHPNLELPQEEKPIFITKKEHNATTGVKKAKQNTKMNWTPAMDAEIMRMVKSRYKYAEIAEKMGCSKKAVGCRIDRIKKETGKAVGKSINAIKSLGTAAVKVSDSIKEAVRNDAFDSLMHAVDMGTINGDKTTISTFLSDEMKKETEPCDGIMMNLSNIKKGLTSIGMKVSGIHINFDEREVEFSGFCDGWHAHVSFTK